MKEIWKDIEGFEGFYQVSNKGRVKSLDRTVLGKDSKVYNYKGKILKTPLNTGYPCVYLSKHHKKHTIRVHILVARAFLSKIKGKYFVNHKDLNKQNNHVSNLEWCTHKENIQHAHFIGVYTAKGECSGKTNLKKDDIIYIRKRLESGENGTVIAKDYNITRQAVSNIKLRKTWKHI